MMARLPTVVPSGLRTFERGAIGAVCLLAFYPAWLRGGTHAPWTLPLPWLALVSLVLLGALAWIESRRERAAGRPSPPAWIPWRDLVLWMGLVFLLLLATQYMNAGRVLYFDTAARAWTYSEPRWAGWPSAITATESRQMLDWFVPAWAILLALRSPRHGTRARRELWRGGARHQDWLS